MANSNFVVKNGLTVGALTIDAATGNITTSGTISGDLATTSIAKNDTSLALNDTGTGSDVAVTIDGTEIFTVTGSGIIPSVNSNGTTGFSLGSASFAWKDVYVSSGSLYVNGQKVLQDDSGTIVVSADANQNISVQTSGSGDIQLDPTGSGIIALKATVQVEAGNNISSSDGNAISFSNSIDVDAIESRSTDTNLTLTANGAGVVYVNDSLTVTGTISGTGATVSFADNIIDLNADLTSGVPSENGGIRILRGDSNAATLLFNETSDVWQIFDGTNTHDVVGADDTQTLTNKTLTSPNMTSPAIGGTTITATADELNILDGVTATFSELNVLDGITATVTELNYTDGVTSAIQTQLDSKAPTASPTITGTATVANMTISGNLTVNGATVTNSATNTTIEDALIELGSGNAGANANDLGLILERGSTGDNAFIGWDESADKFVVGTTTATGASSGDLTITSGTLVAATFEGNLTGNVTGNVTGDVTGDVTGNVTGNLTGNASTATALQTGRTIALSGDVTATGVSFDGTGNITLTTAMAANSVDLTTHTTGNYVAAGATSGNGISGSVSSEGGTFTVTSNATNANTASTIVFRDANGDFSAGKITANLTGNVTGNADTATTATNVTATANNATNETTYITFVDGATGAQGIETDTGLTYNPSTNTLTTSVFSGTATNAQYADLAENYVGDMKYEAGTVVEFGGAEEVTKAAPGSPRIAGVVSTAPGFLMNTGLTGATVVAVAYTGRVPTKISGPCRKGDIMVAGPNGTATRATSEPKAGMIIGKALANFDGNSGVIEIAVGR